jgi:hypothetical protein
MTQKLKNLKTLTEVLLDNSKSIYSLRPEVVELISLIVNFQTIRPTSHLDISGGETQTSKGLALSPTMAAMCAEDFVRTITFIRGTHDAIVDIRKQFPDRPARILYAGCGPYATLVLPLMAIFSSSEAKFTLLDLHSESIISAKSIIDTLCLTESVVSFETLDASSYCISADQPPDVILIEIMQACLESEGQVAITRHLISQAANAILIPEEVSVELKLIDPSKEFNSGSLVDKGGKIQRDQLSLGSVFIINLETVYSWNGTSSNRLPGASIRVPDYNEQLYQPMLFTKIRVYQKHILKEYDSGLTCPRKLSTEETIKAGATIKFHYELGRHPRLIGRVLKRQ